MNFHDLVERYGFGPAYARVERALIDRIHDQVDTSADALSRSISAQFGHLRRRLGLGRKPR